MQKITVHLRRDISTAEKVTFSNNSEISRNNQAIVGTYVLLGCVLAFVGFVWYIATKQTQNRIDKAVELKVYENMQKQQQVSKSP